MKHDAPAPSAARPLAHFVSDLHLQDVDEPHTRILLDFLAGPARDAPALYLLGDLFEAWIGDDAPGAVGEAVIAGLRRASDNGLAIFLQHGNRDFLLGRDFAAAAGLRLLPDPCVIELGGRPTLLSHGDAWCIDDHAYQTARRQLRDPTWQQAFLAQPVAQRLAFARAARAQSAEHQRGVAMALTDVSPAEIDRCFALYGVDRMIHGHTHRPDCHRLRVQDRDCERWVLSDWRGQGEALVAFADGSLQRHTLPAA